MRKGDAAVEREVPVSQFGGSFPFPPSSPAKLAEGDRELQFLLDKIKRNRNVDFTEYRPQVLMNRIQRRMHATNCEGYWDYIVLLNKDFQEYDRLLESLTIKVSEFFRDPTVFELLGNEIIPEIIRGKQAGGADKIRGWSCGTAFGQEAYSLAILFCEVLGERGTNSSVSILATDIDQKAIEEAPWGSYDRKPLDGMKPHILFKYFTRAGERYVVSDKARALVNFRKHDVVSGPPHRGMDIILCRNLLIYFQKELQEKVIHNLYTALNPGGFLVLGMVEAITGEMKDHFEMVDMRERVYRKTRVRGVRSSELGVRS